MLLAHTKRVTARALGRVWASLSHMNSDRKLLIAAFAAIKETDRASQLLWKRCEELMVTSPSAWDGAYQLAEK